MRIGDGDIIDDLGGNSNAVDAMEVGGGETFVPDELLQDEVWESHSPFTAARRFLIGVVFMVLDGT